MTKHLWDWGKTSTQIALELLPKPPSRFNGRTPRLAEHAAAAPTPVTPPTRSRVDSQHLNDAEIGALRGLQKGANQLLPTDPIWRALQERGLVAAPPGEQCAWALTVRGFLYRTD